MKKIVSVKDSGKAKVNLVLSPQCSSQPFEIYPNPSLSGKISVRQLNTDLPYQVHIFDASGKKVWYQSLKNRKTAVERIDLSTEPDGLYFVRIISAQGTAVKKVSLLQEN